MPSRILPLPSFICWFLFLQFGQTVDNPHPLALINCPLERLLQDLKRSNHMETTSSPQKQDPPPQDERSSNHPRINLLLVPPEISTEFQFNVIIQRPFDLLIFKNLNLKQKIPRDLLYLPSGVAFRVISYHEFEDDVFAAFHEFVQIVLKSDQPDKLHDSLTKWWWNTIQLFESTVELRDALNLIISEMETILKLKTPHFLFISKYLDSMKKIASNQMNHEIVGKSEMNKDSMFDFQTLKDHQFQSLEVLLLFAEIAWNHVFYLEMDCNVVCHHKNYPMVIQPDLKRYRSTMFQFFVGIRKKFMGPRNSKRYSLHREGTVLKRCYAEHVVFTNTLRTMYWIYEWRVVGEYTRDITVVIDDVDYVHPLCEELSALEMKHEMYRVSVDPQNYPNNGNEGRMHFMYSEMLIAADSRSEDEEDIISPITSTSITSITNGSDSITSIGTNGHSPFPIAITVDSVKLIYLESSNMADVYNLARHLHTKYPSDLMMTPWCVHSDKNQNNQNNEINQFDDQRIKRYLLDQQVVFDAVRCYFSAPPDIKGIKKWLKLVRNPLIHLFNQNEWGLKEKVFEKLNYFVSGSTSTSVTLMYLQKMFIAGNNNVDFEWIKDENDGMISTRDMLIVIESFLLNVLEYAFQTEYETVQQIVGQQHIQDLLPRTRSLTAGLYQIMTMFQGLKEAISTFRQHQDIAFVNNLMDESCGALSTMVRQLLIVDGVYKWKVADTIHGDVSVVLMQQVEDNRLWEMLHWMPQRVGRYFTIKTIKVRTGSGFEPNGLGGSQASCYKFENDLIFHR